MTAYRPGWCSCNSSHHPATMTIERPPEIGGGGGRTAQGFGGLPKLDRRQFLVGAAGGAILLRLPPEVAGAPSRALGERGSGGGGGVLVPHNTPGLVNNRRFEGTR